MHRPSVGERVARAYARVVVVLRFVVPLAWIAAAIAAWTLLPPLGGSGSAPLGDIVDTDAQAVRAQETAARRFGSTVATDTAIVHRNARGLTREELQSHLRVARSRIPGVQAAVPVPNARIPGTRFAERGTTVVTYLYLAEDLNLVERREVADRYAAQLTRGPGSEVGVTGSGPARLAQFDVIDDALPWIEAATIAVILLIVAVYFRSIGAPLVTLVTAAVAYAVGIRALGWAAERVGVTAPSEIEPVLVVLLLGLATDYTVFYMAEAKRRLAQGEARLPAVRYATARITPVVLTAGVIVAVGAASLVAGRMEFFRAFGPGLALSALVVTAVSITFVPAVLALLGPRLFGARVREAAERAPETRDEDAGDEGSGAVVAPGAPTRRDRWRMRLSGALGSVRASRRHAEAEGGRVLPAFVARLLATRPVALIVAVACVVVLGFAATAARSADLAVSFIPSLPSDSEVRRAADDAARGFVPGVLAPTEVVVEQPGIAQRKPELAKLQALLARRPGVATVLGPAQPPGSPLERAALAPDGGAARYAVLLADEPTGPDAIDDFKRLQRDMPGLLREAGLPPGTKASYAGETALSAETIDSLTGDLGRIAAATILATFLLLALFLRALVAPVLLVFGSVLAFGASFGLATWLLPTTLGGTDFVYYVPLIAGVLLIGLGSDYNVFIAGRIREETRRRRLREAIAVGAPAASHAITVAGITLASTFALLALVPLRPFRELALLMTVGVLLDVLVVRPILIPALIAVVGRASWWPGGAQRPVGEVPFLERVAERTGRGYWNARESTRATLTTLGERIPEGEAREVARQLPGDLARALLEASEGRDVFASDVFVARVARRAHVSEDEAREDARAVFATLEEALPETELQYVRATLSADYAPLFDGQAETKTDLSSV